MFEIEIELTNDVELVKGGFVSLVPLYFTDPVKPGIFQELLVNKLATSLWSSSIIYQTPVGT